MAGSKAGGEGPLLGLEVDLTHESMRAQSRGTPERHLPQLNRAKHETLVLLLHRCSCSHRIAGCACFGAAWAQ
jgi:hypothetical protein